MLVLAALSPDAFDWLAVFWFLALGGVIGSFLNVVIYRVPRGMSLVAPGSHCPACKHPVRWHDNVPVVSWFVLRGRCRDCGARISARYPIVEAPLTAVMFAAILASAFISDGRGLPIRLTRSIEVAGNTTNLPPDGVKLAIICAYYLLLFCTLMTIALVEYDGCRVPVRLALLALELGLVGSIAWPYLYRVQVWPGFGGWLAGPADGVCGLVLGGVLSLLLWPEVRSMRQPAKLLALACIGVYFGYQAVGPILVAALLVHLPLVLLGRFRPAWPRVPLTGWLAVAAFVWILAWQPLVAGRPVFW